MTRRIILTALVGALAAAAPAPLTIVPAAQARIAPAQEQDQLVTVLVVDEVTGLPLGGWDILIGPAGPFDFWYTGTTGNTGTAKFLLPPGAYRAWVSQGGPQVWGATFTVGDDAVRVVVAVNPYENN